MSEKLNLRTPVTYYGGKQKMVNSILPLIPEHKVYCEPFSGGAAIFFAKQPSDIEILNDTNRELMNFYQVLKNDFTSLEKEINISLYSRDLHRKASVIYNNPDMFSEIKRAWALWVLSAQGMNGILDGSWGYEKLNNKTIKAFNNKKSLLTTEYAIRLQNVQLECADAIYVIKSRDTEHTFFYIDPPYYNANMGHYDGYTLEDFKLLLETLSQVKGKFLLSSYRSDILKEFQNRFNWHSKEFKMRVTACAKDKYKEKIEVLTANYTI